MHSPESKGVIYGIIAYTLWGLLPVYWKAVQAVPALEILCHRTAWSFIILLLILTLKRNWQWLRQAVSHPKIMLTFSATALLLGINWLTYIYGVNHGYIVESSLGYFINPIVNVLLGVFILKEKLRIWQWAAVLIAAAGVFYLTMIYGRLPWIALTLAFSFGLYGLLRKTAVLGSLEGLSLETLLMSIPCIIYILFTECTDHGHFFLNMRTSILLAGTGIITAVPLLCFASAARRIQYTTVGLLQYIAPTLQFSIGVLIYQETFDASRLIGFSIIWLALIIYTMESLIRAHRQ